MIRIALSVLFLLTSSAAVVAASGTPGGAVPANGNLPKPAAGTATAAAVDGPITEVAAKKDRFDEVAADLAVQSAAAAATKTNGAARPGGNTPVAAASL